MKKNSQNERQSAGSRASITIDLHGIIDDLVAKLRERGIVDLEAEALRAKSPQFMVITGKKV